MSELEDFEDAGFGREVRAKHGSIDLKHAPRCSGLNARKKLCQRAGLTIIDGKPYCWSHAPFPKETA